MSLTKHNRRLALALPMLLVTLALGGTLHDAAAQAPSPPEGFEKVSSLVELPDFIPGLGILYVNPSTLPAGPFLAYDRDGTQVSTLYMIPLDAINDHETFNGLGASEASVDHVDVNFNAGHPGVAEPHYHIVLWHVSEARAARLANP